MRHSLLVLAFLVVGLSVLVVGSAAAAEPEGTDVEIQQQIDALGEQGGVVTLEAKTYVIRKTVILPNFVTLRGAGRDKTVLVLADETNDSVIRNELFSRGAMRGAHDVAIANLTIDANGKNQAENVSRGGIWFEYTYNYRIENVHLKNARAIGGIFTNPTHDIHNKAQKNYIVNCIVEGTLENKPSPGAHPGNGIWVTGHADNNNVLIKGNIVRDNFNNGIFAEDRIECIFVEENESSGNGNNGIWFCGVRYSAIKGNRIHHNRAAGILISQTKWTQNNLVYGNVVHDNGAPGFVIDFTYGPGEAYHVIVGNVFKNNGGTGIDIRSSATDNVVAFNYCTDDRDNKKQKVGLVTASQNNLIINNYLKGNAEAESKIAENNVVVLWDYDKPWTPENLVNWYGESLTTGGGEAE